ncbi:hypothetical protein AB5I41_24645 [Sphingomonas sp. MMS24-JH45]
MWGLILAASTALAFAGLGMTGHMAAHMLAVAVAAPVLALSLPSREGQSWSGRYGWRPRGGAVPPSLHPPPTPPWKGGESRALPLGDGQFFVVWAWRLPAARPCQQGRGRGAGEEQALFLRVGVMLWRTALAQPAAGVASLLLVRWA